MIVVDRSGGSGQGSTSASSAIVRFNYSTLDGVAVAWESSRCWAEWADHLEAGAGAGAGAASLRRTGFVALDAPIATPERACALFDKAGVPYERWDAGTLRERVPGLDPGRHWPPKRIDDEAFWADADGELDGVFTPDGGFVDDPMLATRNLADAALRHDAEFLFRRQVTGVRRSGDRTAGVLLAGVGADFTVGVRPMRQEVHHVTAPPGYNDGDRLGPVVSDPDLGVYLRAAPGDIMMVGGTEPECDPLGWVDDPDAVTPFPTAAVFEAQVTRAARRFPELAVPPRPKEIVGVYDVADDWTPIYDRTELDGYYVAMGTSGNQFKNAPMAGLMMAALITAVENGHDHDADPLAYTCPRTGLVVDLGRFSRRRPLNTESSGTVMG